MSQWRQLALLAFLAGQPGLAVARDRLVDVLWPGRNAVRARHRLSDSLYLVRRTLGDESIVTHGDTVSLNLEIVWTDIAAFEQALGEADFLRVDELYRGPFLEGFPVDRSDEFARWTADERRRRKHQVLEALRSMADREEEVGNLTGAVNWVRRSLEIEPTYEVGLRRHITLLDRLGDQAGALRAFAAFAGRLEQELGVEPAPETRALVARIEGRAAGAKRDTDSRLHAASAVALILVAAAAMLVIWYLIG